MINIPSLGNCWSTSSFPLLPDEQYESFSSEERSRLLDLFNEKSRRAPAVTQIVRELFLELGKTNPVPSFITYPLKEQRLALAMGNERRNIIQMLFYIIIFLSIPSTYIKFVGSRWKGEEYLIISLSSVFFLSIIFTVIQGWTHNETKQVLQMFFSAIAFCRSNNEYLKQALAHKIDSAESEEDARLYSRAQASLERLINHYRCEELARDDRLSLHPVILALGSELTRGAPQHQRDEGSFTLEIL